jgi:hypothetical protein
VLGLSDSAGVGGRLVKRYWRDVRRRGRLYQFNRALNSNEFDIQVLENYGRDFYLGMYFPYSWPLTRQSVRAVVRDSVNYIAAVSGAHATARPRARSRTVGPWNRPDRSVERAAIRAVKKGLRADGFQVRSRESEVCGYDLHATRNGSELHVEVKGVAGEVPRFFLTRTEMNQAEHDPKWRLAIVLRATIQPRLQPYLRGTALRTRFKLAPTQWYASTA